MCVCVCVCVGVCVCGCRRGGGGLSDTLPFTLSAKGLPRTMHVSLSKSIMRLRFRFAGAHTGYSWTLVNGVSFTAHLGACSSTQQAYTKDA